jgi:hypothetical protein
MRRFVEGTDRGQSTLFECLEDWIDENNPVRVIDAFVEQLDLSGLGFDGVAPRGNRPAFMAGPSHSETSGTVRKSSHSTGWREAHWPHGS